MPKRIKIKTCRLPKDFFMDATPPLVKTRSSSETRGSTRDQDSLPGTPCFGRIKRGTSQELKSKFKGRGRMLGVGIEDIEHLDLIRSSGNSLNLRMVRQLSEKTGGIELPPIATARTHLAF